MVSSTPTHTRALAAIAAAGALAAGAAALADSAGGAATAARAAGASAAAYAREDGNGVRHAYVSASGGRSASGSGTAARTSVAGGHGRASASASVSNVSIFGGLVTADSASARASAAGGGASVSGRVTRLNINGRDRGTVTQPRTFSLGGYGRLVALDSSGGAIVALRATLTRRYGGSPAGTTVRVAFASASAHDAVAPPRPKPAPKPKPRSATPKPHATSGSKHAPSKHAKARKPKRRGPSRAHVLLTGKGYMFPVYGAHQYTDTYGAPRADTGFHEGDDIFANAGTPVVAVCDGTLNRVGTLPIAGNRLWNKCSAGGDSFFYAHLSSYATDTHSGATVKAGQVIGFVGSTGDAEHTPPHVHFEIHPANGKKHGDPPAVDPTPFLRAWERHPDPRAAGWVARNGEPGEQQPGALVVVRDFLDR